MEKQIKQETKRNNPGGKEVRGGRAEVVSSGVGGDHCEAGGFKQECRGADDYREEMQWMVPNTSSPSVTWMSPSAWAYCSLP